MSQLSEEIERLRLRVEEERELKEGVKVELREYDRQMSRLQNRVDELEGMISIFRAREGKYLEDTKKQRVIYK